MAPIPKPPGQKRRRNAGQTAWKRLSAANDGEIPKLPRREPAWSEMTKRWWASVWRSPAATMWLESDYFVVLRLADLREALAENPKTSALHAQASSLEAALGLNPAARRRLQWEMETMKTEPDSSPIRRIKVDDPRG